MTIKHKDASKFEREDRYLVIKRSDIDKFLTCSEKEKLYKLADVVCDGRIIFSGSPLECVVVESDWPIYNDVWNMVEAIATNQPTELVRLRKELDDSKAQSLVQSWDVEKLLVVMQSFYIELAQGNQKGANSWIVNTLFGPGLIPENTEISAQEHFDSKLKDRIETLQEAKAKLSSGDDDD